MGKSEHEVLWSNPSSGETPMGDFMWHINDKYGTRHDSYGHLYKWSIDNVPQFWAEVWDFVGIRASKTWDGHGSQQFEGVSFLRTLCQLQIPLALPKHQLWASCLL